MLNKRPIHIFDRISYFLFIYFSSFQKLCQCKKRKKFFTLTKVLKRKEINQSRVNSNLKNPTYDRKYRWGLYLTYQKTSMKRSMPHPDVFWYRLNAMGAPKKCAQKSSCNTFSIYISHKN